MFGSEDHWKPNKRARKGERGSSNARVLIRMNLNVHLKLSNVSYVIWMMFQQIGKINDEVQCKNQNFMNKGERLEMFGRMFFFLKICKHHPAASTKHQRVDCRKMLLSLLMHWLCCAISSYILIIRRSMVIMR